MSRADKTNAKYCKMFSEILELGISINEYAKAKGMAACTFSNKVRKTREKEEKSEQDLKLLDLYDKIVNRTISQSFSNKGNETKCDSENYIDASYDRDEDGKIIGYRFKIYKKDKPALSGVLTREEMSRMIRLYTYEGCNLTAKVVSREFPQYSVQDIKRIFRAFAIYKDNCPFAPHDVEEKTVEELRDIQLREKKNDFMRKAEEERIKNNEKLLKKYFQENMELKEQLRNLSDIKLELPEITPLKLGDYEEVGQSINLYLSDFHLGSYTTFGSLYTTNNNYGFDEAKRRLTQVLLELGKLDCFDTINIVLLGDMIDCCGITGKTARLDHAMPNNMDAKKQINSYINLMDWFITSLYDSDRALTAKINIYSVPNGNHDGAYGYAANKWLESFVNAKFPDINVTIFESFYGKFEQNDHIFLICHGKDEMYMKRGLPLNLNDQTKVLLYEFLMSEGITGKNVHFIKGDLHSNNLSSCKVCDYRNVLSLYGSSDYSAYNFSENSYGVSYDLLIGNKLLRGTFENM